MHDQWIDFFQFANSFLSSHAEIILTSERLERKLKPPLANAHHLKYLLLHSVMKTNMCTASGLLTLCDHYRKCCLSFISPLLLRENDFCVCLKDSFPQLKTHRLTRPEWCKIRRLMGKPRR